MATVGKVFLSILALVIVSALWSAFVVDPARDFSLYDQFVGGVLPQQPDGSYPPAVLGVNCPDDGATKNVCGSFISVYNKSTLKPVEEIKNWNPRIALDLFSRQGSPKKPVHAFRFGSVRQVNGVPTVEVLYIASSGRVSHCDYQVKYRDDLRKWEITGRTPLTGNTGSCLL